MELWDGYNEKCEKIGIDLIRGEGIPQGLFHVVVEVMVIHTDGSYLLMQRDFNKPNSPGLFEAGASGSVIKGETFIEGAKRELREETGIISETLSQIHYSINSHNHTIYIGYLCEWSGDKNLITLQEGETISYKWLSRSDFLTFVKTDSYVAAGRVRLSNYLDRIS